MAFRTVLETGILQAFGSAEVETHRNGHRARGSAGTGEGSSGRAFSHTGGGCRRPTGGQDDLFPGKILGQGLDSNVRGEKGEGRRATTDRRWSTGTWHVARTGSSVERRAVIEQIAAIIFTRIFDTGNGVACRGAMRDTGRPCHRVGAEDVTA
jgi:hypothetical protein